MQQDDELNDELYEARQQALNSAFKKIPHPSLEGATTTRFEQALIASGNLRSACDYCQLDYNWIVTESKSNKWLSVTIQFGIGKHTGMLLQRISDLLFNDKYQLSAEQVISLLQTRELVISTFRPQTTRIGATP